MQVGVLQTSGNYRAQGTFQTMAVVLGACWHCYSREHTAQAKGIATKTFQH